MPLRDHFRPPVWTKASWEGFHGMWPASMVQQLFPLLPEGYTAEPRVHLGDYYEIDVCAFEGRASAPSLDVIASAESGGNSASTAPVQPPTAGTGSAQELLESAGQGSSESVPPSTGGISPSTKPPATPPGTGSIPSAPPGASPQGDEAEPATAQQPAAPPFEASDNPGPKPWVPIGIGLGASALALASVLLLGRRFSW